MTKAHEVASPCADWSEHTFGMRHIASHSLWTSLNNVGQKYHDMKIFWRVSCPEKCPLQALSWQATKMEGTSTLDTHLLNKPSAPRLNYLWPTIAKCQLLTLTFLLSSIVHFPNNCWVAENSTTPPYYSDCVVTSPKNIYRKFGDPYTSKRSTIWEIDHEHGGMRRVNACDFARVEKPLRWLKGISKGCDNILGLSDWMGFLHFRYKQWGGHMLCVSTYQLSSFIVIQFSIIIIFIYNISLIFIFVFCS